MSDRTYSVWTSYPWYLRLPAVLGVLTAVTECGTTPYFLWTTCERSRSGDPGYQGWLLAPPLVIGGLMVVAAFAIFTRLALSSWVVVYRLSDLMVPGYNVLLVRHTLPSLSGGRSATV